MVSRSILGGQFNPLVFWYPLDYLLINQLFFLGGGRVPKIGTGVSFWTTTYESKYRVRSLENHMHDSHPSNSSDIPPNMAGSLPIETQEFPEFPMVTVPMSSINHFDNLSFFHGKEFI